tara:strand:- start:1763 stop:1954 length:192 start_codon:yes stop_codon:yes gene_type:complete
MLNTTKTENGFSFTLREFTQTAEPQENGHYGVTVTVKHKDGYRSRARAASAGVKWKMYFKRAV